MGTAPTLVVDVIAAGDLLGDEIEIDFGGDYRRLVLLDSICIDGSVISWQMPNAERSAVRVRGFLGFSVAIYC